MGRRRPDPGPGPPPGRRPPGDPILRYRALFESLDPDLPLALLPVRLETRYTSETELIVRIFPDIVHADRHAPDLTRTEIDLGRAFWERWWRSGADAEARDAAFAWLAGRLGPWRAGYVARALRPRNLARAPDSPVPPGSTPDPRPAFPALEPRTSGTQTRARLLPQRFVAVGYVEGEPAGTWFGEEVPEDLVVAPGFVAPGEIADAQALMEDEGILWCLDVDAAIDVGMAIRIDLREATRPGARRGFDRLVVLGIRGDDQRSAVEDLLAAQRATRGLDLAPQGMPTNRTETAAAALDPARPDLAALLSAELSAGPARRPRISGGGSLYRQSEADAASIALGLGARNALDRSSRAAGRQPAWAEGMNRTLWPATFGQYLRSLMQGILDQDARAWLRDWATSFVRGGAHLPTLLVGRQPYGLLPVSLVRRPAATVTNVEHVEDVLLTLRGHWDASLAGVAHLDPNLTDAPADPLKDDDLAATVSTVLGGVPHPTGLELRPVEAKREDYAAAFGFQMFLLGLGCTQYPDQNGNPFPNSEDNPAWRRFEQLESEIELFGDTTALERASTYFGHAVEIDGVPLTSEQAARFAALAALIDDDMLPLARRHDERIAPVAAFFTAVTPSVSFNVGDDTAPEAFFAYYGADGSEAPWRAPLVAAGRGPDDVDAVAGYLAEAAADLADPAADAYDYGRPLPLLRHLVHRAVEQAGATDDRDLLAAGLATLQEVVAESDEPIGELERLLREHLGTVAYRLDAWYTAVAAWRLERARVRSRTGIQVGAYGFVVGLRPREARASQGHVAAPSLEHATTAAVLRAGWAALGGTGESAGLAVDLSSDRVRRARWIVDGVRRGQDLAVLLGSRLERRLHDADLSAWVEPIRQVALDAVGSPAPPVAIVDGLLLSRARSGAGDLDDRERAARRALNDLLASPDRPRGDPSAALDDLASDLDAVADLTMAESVHALVQGRAPAAATTLTAAATGDVSIPEPTVADTPRSALQITHRLILLVDPNASGGWPGAPASGRALAAPGLEAWASELLGDPGDLGFQVRFEDGAGAVATSSHTLADVGLAALDALFLVPGGEDVGLGRLGSLLEAWAETLRPADMPPTSAPVIDVDGATRMRVIAARALQRLVTGARDLDGRDLVAPSASDAASGLDPGDLQGRVNAVVAALRGLRARLLAALPADGQAAPRGDVRRAMLGLAGFELPGAIPTAADEAALVAEGRALVGRIDRRLDELARRAAGEREEWPALDDTRRTQLLAGRLGLLVGAAIPLAPRFAAANAEALDATAARRRIGGGDEVTAWLGQAGRVDPGAERLRIAVDLCEAARAGSRFDFALMQLPDHPEEGWAATGAPVADERGRLCIVATGAPAAFVGGPVAGLVLASWSESLARPDHPAGVAFHFDAAGTRAPQAVLLCVAPDEGFSVEGVRDMIGQTLDLARLRTVGPQSLLDLGQYLPATYLPDTLDAGGPAP